MEDRFTVTGVLYNGNGNKIEYYVENSGRMYLLSRADVIRMYEADESIPDEERNEDNFEYWLAGMQNSNVITKLL